MAKGKAKAAAIPSRANKAEAIPSRTSPKKPTTADSSSRVLAMSGAALAALSELQLRSKRTTGAEVRALHSCGIPASPIECMPNRQSALLPAASFSRQDATVRGIGG